MHLYGFSGLWVLVLKNTPRWLFLSFLIDEPTGSNSFFSRASHTFSLRSQEGFDRFLEKLFFTALNDSLLCISSFNTTKSPSESDSSKRSLKGLSSRIALTLLLSFCSSQIPPWILKRTAEVTNWSLSVPGTMIDARWIVATTWMRDRPTAGLNSGTWLRTVTVWGARCWLDELRKPADPWCSPTSPAFVWGGSCVFINIFYADTKSPSDLVSKNACPFVRLQETCIFRFVDDQLIRHTNEIQKKKTQHDIFRCIRWDYTSLTTQETKDYSS